MHIENQEEFSKKLPPDGRVLGLDVGETTIGLALSDSGRRIASPLSTIERTRFSKDMAKLESIVSSNKIVGLVPIQ